MKMVYLNGQFLAPDGALASSSMDFAFKKGRLHFEFTLKRNDIVAVVKTFLGVTWSRRFYIVENYKTIKPNTPLRLGSGGKIVAEGIMATVQDPPARQDDYNVA
jgi:hypothetical protein